MQEKLKALALRYEDLEFQLSQPTVYGNSEKLRSINRELKELGPVVETYQAYCQAIDPVRACQPNAVIYVQTLIPLNEGKIAATGGFSYLKNDRLRAYNELICKAAAEKQVPVLDLYTHFAVDGQLPAEASRDGVHLMAPYCKQQLEYFKTHTIDYQTLYAPPELPPSDTPEEPLPDTPEEPLPDTPETPALPSPDVSSHTSQEVTTP